MRTMMHNCSLIFCITILACCLSIVDSHGAVTHVNGVEGASRNWLANRMKRDKMREWDAFSMNGDDGRVDNTGRPCGEMQDVVYGNRYSTNAPFYSDLKTNGSCLDTKTNKLREECLQYTDILKTPAALGGQKWSVGTYNPQKPVTLRVKTTAMHGGMYEVRYVCADSLVGKNGDKLKVIDFYEEETSIKTANECLNPDTPDFKRPMSSAMWKDGKCYNPRVLHRNVASVSDEDKKYNYMPDYPQWYLIPMSSENLCFPNNLGTASAPTVDIKYDLPDTLKTCNEVVLQWWWQTSNNCIPKEWTLALKKSRFPNDCPDWPQSALGWNVAGGQTKFCSPTADDKGQSGEQFANCINLSLDVNAPDEGTPSDGGESSPTPTPGNPSPTPGNPSPTPAADGADCTGCWAGTSGPCKGSNTVCWAYQEVHGKKLCPGNTTECSPSNSGSTASNCEGVWENGVNGEKVCGSDCKTLKFNVTKVEKDGGTCENKDKTVDCSPGDGSCPPAESCVGSWQPPTEQKADGSSTPKESERVVIYIDWKVTWGKLDDDIKKAVDLGATEVVLGFWFYDKVADAATEWQNLEDTKKDACLKYIHDKGAYLMIAAGGATEPIENYVSKNSPTGDEYGKAAADYALQYKYDGIDFDLELTPGNFTPMKDGTFVDWAVACSKKARFIANTDTSKTKFIISHAPQGPYFSPEWTQNEKAGYVEIWKQAGSDLDYLFIQYYNQGVGTYMDYDQLFVKSDKISAVVGTSVKELVSKGIPSKSIVVGKPVKMKGHASNGMLKAKDFSDMVIKARTDDANGKFEGGVGGWMYEPNNAEVESWLQEMSKTRGNVKKSTCSNSCDPLTYVISRAASNGGAACPHTDQEKSTCDKSKCKVIDDSVDKDCEGKWSPAECPSSCESQKFVVTQAKQGNGKECENLNKTKQCEPGWGSCPLNIDCSGRWGACSAGINPCKRIFLIQTPKSGKGKDCPTNPDVPCSVKDGECIDQCTDGAKNGDETDIDCGGNFCAKCLSNCVPKDKTEITGEDCKCGGVGCKTGSFCYKKLGSTENSCNKFAKTSSQDCVSKDKTAIATEACKCGDTASCAVNSFCYKKDGDVKNSCNNFPKCSDSESTKISKECFCGADSCKIGKWCYKDEGNASTCFDSAKIQLCAAKNKTAITDTPCKCGASSCDVGKFCFKKELEDTNSCNLHPKCNTVGNTNSKILTECTCGTSSCQAGKFCYKMKTTDKQPSCNDEARPLTCNDSDTQVITTKCFCGADSICDPGKYCFMDSQNKANCSEPDCVGAWSPSSCAADCANLVYKITKEAQGNGKKCEATNNAIKECKEGDGSCTAKNLDCVGAWSPSSCAADCANLAYKITTEAQGNGKKCEATNNAIKECKVGDGLCVEKTLTPEDKNDEDKNDGANFGGGKNDENEPDDSLESDVSIGAASKSNVLILSFLIAFVTALFF